MNCLLVDHDEERRASWLKRLEGCDVTVVSVASLEEALIVVGKSRFTLTICSWECCELVDRELKNHATTKFESRSEVTLALVPSGNHSCIETVLLSGFGDYLIDDCSDAELVAKLQHARHMQTVSERLAQAQKLESIGELAAGIAHEINTPIQYVGDNTRFVRTAYDDLRGVLESSQQLLAAVNASGDIQSVSDQLRTAMEDADVEYLLEELPAAIDQTLEGVDRVANIVRAMKEFAHPGVSELTLTDLAHSIANTIMVARNEWKYVANMETDFDPDLPEVPCLPGELNQVLLNMIVNAAHAVGDALGDSPDAKGTIRICTSRIGEQAEIRIADSGSGIATENLERIFAPFFTTKAAGKGTGQGLAIAHTVIVEKHKGTIEVESEIGKGTSFVIRLPLDGAREAEFRDDQQGEVVTAKN